MTTKRRSPMPHPWGAPIQFKDPVSGPVRAIRALLQEQARMEAAREHARQDGLNFKAGAAAIAVGHTYANCDRCGKEKVLSWIGGSCTEFSADTDDQVCGGTYRATSDGLLTVSL